MSDSTLSVAPLIRRALASALAGSRINPFGVCGEDNASVAQTAADRDITRGFHATLTRRDIVDETFAAMADVPLPRSAGRDRPRDIRAATAGIDLSTPAQSTGASSALATFIDVASTTIRGGAHKTLARLADAVASVPPPAMPTIACWVGTVTFVALPLLPDAGMPRNRPGAPPQFPQTVNSDQAGSSEIAMSLPEDKPPIGATLQFNRMNLRYCVYQQVRLEAIGPVTYSTESDVFSALIKDWNSRCSRFHYAAGDKEAVDSEIKARRPALEAEGRAMVRGWQRKIETSLQRIPAPEPATAVATNSSSRSETSDPLPSIIMLGRNPKSELSFGFNPLLKSPSLVLLRPDSAMRVQERLNELGYTIKPADGNWGPTSRNALRHFKEANGLLANDGFDVETAVRLFSASASRAIAGGAGSAGEAPGTIESAYPPPPGASLNPLNRADADRIQHRLAALGYYGGKIFGLWGTTSRKALRAFKAANDLADDDEWDAITETVLNDEQAARVAATVVEPPGTTAAISAAVKPDLAKPDTAARSAAPKSVKRSVLSPDEPQRPPSSVPAPTPRPATR